MKRRIVHALQKYVLNPRSSCCSRWDFFRRYALLETIAKTEAAAHAVAMASGQRFWLVLNTDGRRLRAQYCGNPRVRVKLRRRLAAALV